MTASEVLRRGWHFVPAALVATAALLGARGVSAILAAGLAPSSEALARGAILDVLSRPAAEAPKSAEAILRRNPFDSDHVPLGAPADDAPPVAMAGDLPCPNVHVMAIVTSEDPEWSFAALSLDGEPHTSLRRKGGAVGSMTVTSIEPERVSLTSGAKVCEAAMFQPAAPPSASASAPPAEAPLKVAGVERKGPTDFAVDRGALDGWLEHQADFIRDIQIAPEKDPASGRPIGVRVAHLRPGSTLAALGLEQGDVLETLNGYDMTTPQSMLEAYARLPSASRLTLHLTRHGQPVNVDYEIK
jgi:general secretion pathway protein C